MLCNTRHIRGLSMAALCMVGFAVLIPFEVHAQEKKPQPAKTLAGQVQAVQTPGASLYDPRTPLPSDSARTLRGFSDFSDYRAPSMCHAMVQALAERTRRSWTQDTLDPSLRMTRPLPSLVIETGKQCASRFAVGAVDPSELQQFERLALSIGDDALARSIVERRLSLVQTVGDSADVLEQSVGALVAAEPFRMAQAKATIGRLEQLGPKAARATFLAQAQLVMEFKRYAFEPLEQTGIAARAIAQAKKLLISDRDDLAAELNNVWLIRMQTLLFVSRDSTVELGAQMVQDIASLRNGTYRTWSRSYQELFATQVFPKLGKPLDNFPTEANYLYASASLPEARLGQLPRGTVYFVMVVPEIRPREHGLIRRLHERYGKRGLSIVVISGTKGYTSWNASGVLTPSEEATSLRTFTFDHLKLPVTLMVEPVPSQANADGRMVYAPTQWYARLPVVSSIINHDGTLEMGFFLLMQGEVEAYLERALQRAAKEGGTASNSSR